jgi:hypothetical protein
MCGLHSVSRRSTAANPRAYTRRNPRARIRVAESIEYIEIRYVATKFWIEKAMVSPYVLSGKLCPRWYNPEIVLHTVSNCS